MVLLLRIAFTALFVWCLAEARKSAQTNFAAGDLDNAFWLAITVVVALAAAATWAPYFGAKVADPLTGGLVKSPYVERSNYLMQLIRFCDKKRKRRLVRWLCFIEGVRAPWIPIAFYLGLKNSEEGSLLERIFAREVFTFSNVSEALKAFEALSRHGIDPRPHNNPDVNLALVSLHRAEAREPEKLVAVPSKERAPLRRNPRIKIGKE